MPAILSGFTQCVTFTHINRDAYIPIPTRLRETKNSDVFRLEELDDPYSIEQEEFYNAYIEMNGGKENINRNHVPVQVARQEAISYKELFEKTLSPLAKLCRDARTRFAERNRTYNGIGLAYYEQVAGYRESEKLLRIELSEILGRDVPQETKETQADDV
jgi:hypothetical protein